MDVELSDEAVAEYERLERDAPATFEVLLSDLAMVQVTALDDLEVWATLAGLTYYLGPSGRVRYWAVLERDRLVVEFFDVDP